MLSESRAKANKIMTRIEKLEESVRNLYKAQDPERSDWADWLGEHHVFLVAGKAAKLADMYGANPDLAQAAALLHDIADTKMSRFAQTHEETSLHMARELMKAAGFNDAEIKLAVDDAIRYHGCHDGRIPNSLEGKVLASADAAAHLQSDYYIFATWALGKEKDLPEVKKWVLKKIDRDFNNKILFDDIKDLCRKDYEQLKELFSR